jgi:hypothetical protein
MVESVHLVLRGPSLTLSRLSSERFPLIIDLSNIHGPGEATFTISRVNADLPEAIMLERAIPSQIRLTLEARVVRQVAVKPRFSHIPEGMEVASAVVTPARLTVIGPEGRTNQIQEVLTDAIDLRTLSAGGEAETTCYAGDPQVNFASSPQVKIKVTLAPAGSTARGTQNLPPAATPQK